MKHVVCTRFSIYHPTCRCYIPKIIHTDLSCTYFCYQCEFRCAKAPNTASWKERERKKVLPKECSGSAKCEWWTSFLFSLNQYFFVGLVFLRSVSILLHIGWYTSCWFLSVFVHNRIKAFLDAEPTFNAKHSGRTPRIKRLSHSHLLSLSLLLSTRLCVCIFQFVPYILRWVNNVVICERSVCESVRFHLFSVLLYLYTHIRSSHRLATMHIRQLIARCRCEAETRRIWTAHTINTHILNAHTKNTSDFFFVRLFYLHGVAIVSSLNRS